MVDLTLRGHYDAVRGLIRSGDLQQAAGLCERILRTFPRDLTTYFLLGRVYLDLGEHTQAANLFRRVLSADPEHVMAYASLGAICDGRGLVDEALWQMERALELSPSNREIRREVRRLYAQRDMAVSERIKMNRAGLARTFLRGGLYAKAIGELRELISEQPHRYDLRVALGRALWHDGRFADVEAVCQGVLAQLPNCLQANLLLGRIWLNTDRDEDARKMLQKVQALDPDNRAAQALFGANSPLPPRVARLPMEEGDVAPFDLPYLHEDHPIIEGEIVGSIVAEAARPKLRLEAFPGALEHHAGLDEPLVSGEAGKPRGVDSAQGLAQARHLWQLGDIGQSVAVLRRLLTQSPGSRVAIEAELRLINRIHSGQIQVVEAIWYARRADGIVSGSK